MHIPESETVLRRLVDALRPGDVVMLEEDDIHPVLATARAPTTPREGLPGADVEPGGSL
jgi:hypothetical protein